jgi:hypothetical protein
MNVPPQLYAIGLVELMKQQNVQHFEIDLTQDPEQARGLSINFNIEGGKLVISNGRCSCAECAAKVGRS